MNTISIYLSKSIKFISNFCLTSLKLFLFHRFSLHLSILISINLTFKNKRKTTTANEKPEK